MAEVKIPQKMSPKERIDHLLKVLDMNKAQFCRNILGDAGQGQNMTNYTHPTKPKNPKDKFWLTIAEKLPDIDRIWLFTGTGTPYYPGMTPVSISLEDQLKQLQEKYEALQKENEDLRREKDTILKLAQLAMPGKSEGVTDGLIDHEGASELLTGCVINRARVQCVKPRQGSI